MNLIIKLVPLFLSTTLFLLLSCEGSSFQDSGKVESASPSSSEVEPHEPYCCEEPYDHPDPPNPIAEDIIKEWESLSPEDREAFLRAHLESNSNSTKQKMKICLWYNPEKDTQYDGHYCDNAKFFVYFNDEIDNGNITTNRIINLNNGNGPNNQGRDVTTLSGKTFHITPVDRPPGSKVPGIEFSSTWTKGSFRMKTSCALKKNEATGSRSRSCSKDYDSSCCHSYGVVFLSVIGKLSLNYKGKSVSMYYTQNGTKPISTDQIYTYDLNDYLDSGELTNQEYKFNDWCKPVKKN